MPADLLAAYDTAKWLIAAGCVLWSVSAWVTARALRELGDVEERLRRLRDAARAGTGGADQ